MLLWGGFKGETVPGADLGGGCRGCASPLPWDDLRFSNTTAILQKKKLWFIGVEVEQETSAPPPKKNPGSAPESCTKLQASLPTERLIKEVLEML